METLVAKMQKKAAAAGGADEDGDEPTDVEATLPEAGGAKEPTHSEELILLEMKAEIAPAVAVAGAANGEDIVENDGLQVSYGISRKADSVAPHRSLAQQ